MQVSSKAGVGRSSQAVEAGHARDTRIDVDVRLGDLRNQRL